MKIEKKKGEAEENKEQFIGETHIKSKYELFGVKQQQDDELQTISIEDIEKAKKFLSFAIQNFRKNFFEVYRIETENFPKSEFDSEFLKINSDFFSSGKTFSKNEIEREVEKLLDIVKGKLVEGQRFSLSWAIDSKEYILLILSKVEKTERKRRYEKEIWTQVAFLIKAVEITN
jgi:lipopolysaccharide export LptBFGC system permease protein LptF